MIRRKITHRIAYKNKRNSNISAVQNERDRITSNQKRSASTGGNAGGSSRKMMRGDGGGDDDQESLEGDGKSRRTTPEPPNQYVEILMKAEAVTKHLRNTVITRTADQVPSPARLISSNDVLDSSPVSVRSPRPLPARNSPSYSYSVLLLLPFPWSLAVA